MGAQQPSASGQDLSRESDLEHLYYVFTSSPVLLVNWWQRSVTEDKDGSLRESSAHRRDREILSGTALLCWETNVEICGKIFLCAVG